MTISSPNRLTRATLAPLSLAAASINLAGCGYFETQLQRTAQADPRIVLEPRDRVSLYAREVVNYRCGHRYFLRCERAGSITLSCTCRMR